MAIKDLKDEGTIGLPSGQPFIRQTHLAGMNYGSGWVKHGPNEFHSRESKCLFFQVGSGIWLEIGLGFGRGFIVPGRNE